MIKGLYILDANSYEMIYGPPEREDIAKHVDIYAPAQNSQVAKENPRVLKDVEVIFSGWGGPHIDEEFLALAPNLKAVLYGAGSVKGIVSDALWKRGVLISSAYGANAVPVAEYTLSQILWCLKRGWQFALETRRDAKHPPRYKVPGAYDRHVGIIALGMIGRKVCDLLKAFDLHVLAYDPTVTQDDVADLGVELCPLDDIFRRSDVVSLHAPWIEETVGMITGAHFESMKQTAAFINTSRGALVREEEMIEVLKKRPDICAVLDVTHPEPPEPGSPLFTMDNVILTPHIAGAMDQECRRMGRYMCEELLRYIDGKPLKYGMTPEKVAVST